MSSMKFQYSFWPPFCRFPAKESRDLCSRRIGIFKPDRCWGMCSPEMFAYHRYWGSYLELGMIYEIIWTYVCNFGVASMLPCLWSKLCSSTFALDPKRSKDGKDVVYYLAQEDIQIWPLKLWLLWLLRRSLWWYKTPIRPSCCPYSTVASWCALAGKPAGVWGNFWYPLNLKRKMMTQCHTTLQNCSDLKQSHPLKGWFWKFISINSW